MFRYNEVCKELKKAQPKGDPPSYELNENGECENVYLLEKAEKLYDKWITHDSENIAYLPKLIGCCEIGEFTGNELIRVLLDIFKNKNIYQAGNRICLNVNGHSVAMLIFSKVSLLTTGAPPIADDNVAEGDMEYRGMFVKLFNDRRVKSFRASEFKAHYTPALINKYRQEAKNLYPQFLSGKISDFPDFKYRNSFLGLIAKCTFRMSLINPLWEISKTKADFDLVPFLACIEFAFFSKQTGMISDLLGELHRTHSADNTSVYFISNTIIETSRKLVQMGVPKAKKSKKLYERIQTQTIRQELENIYGS